jgi:raffinose/stachyose/melibiose transport system substrate-binding protein
VSGTISYWTNNTNPVEKQIVSAFEAAYPKVHVNLTQDSTDAYLAALATGASNHDLPDVFFEGLGATLAHQYEDAGLIYDMTSYAQAHDWKDAYTPLSLQLLEYKGKDWEVPLDTPGMGVFYRKDIFSKLGITPPTSFADFTADLAKIKAAGITPISMGGQQYWLPMRVTDALIEEYGGANFYTQLAERKASWSDPAVVKAFTTLHDWTTASYLTPGFLAINPSNDGIPFFQGAAAMVIEGSWEDGTINSQKLDMSDYGFFPFPVDQNPNPLSVFAQGIMIGANTKNPQAALAFTSFYTSQANLEQFGNEISQPVALKAVQPPATQPNALQIAGLIAKEGVGYLPTDQILPQQLVNEFSTEQAAVIGGTSSPTAAANALAKAVTSYTGSWPWGDQPVP